MSDIWNMLKEYFLEDRHDYHSSPVAKGEIKEAEKKISSNFTDSYKKFVKKYGGAMVCGDFIYGLRKQEDMDNDLWSVIQNTNFYKKQQQWPGIEDWYVISDDGRGNPIGCKPDGSVWLSDHDAGFEQIKLADSFEEFLYKLLTNTLYE